MVIRKSELSMKQGSDMGVRECDNQHIVDLLQKAADVCYELGMLMQHEKNVFHSRGLQGFKRCFRYASRQYFERAMVLECLIIDCFNGLPMSDAAYESPHYDGSCTEHLRMICDTLHEASCTLSEIIAALIEEKEFCAADKVKCSLHSIYKEIKYMRRHCAYLESISGDMAKVQWYSEVLHGEMQSLEESKHNRYY